MGGLVGWVAWSYNNTQPSWSRGLAEIGNILLYSSGESDFLYVWMFVFMSACMSWNMSAYMSACLYNIGLMNFFSLELPTSMWRLSFVFFKLNDVFLVVKNKFLTLWLP